MIEDWEFWRAQPKEHGDYVWGEECFLSRDWTLRVPPVANAEDAVWELYDHGQDLFVVSDRLPHMKEWIEAWLNRNDFPPMQVTTTSKKEPGNRKIDAARRLGLTKVVEDAPHHTTEMPASGLFDQVYVIDKPYNQQVPQHERLHRVFDWWEVCDHAWEYR
jgi:uncharacterized HAD superfamily protein